MERELLVSLLRVAESLEDARGRPVRGSYTNLEVLAVLLWAALNDRPVSWATDRRNWPVCLRRRKLPSNSTLSRRARCGTIARLLDAMIDRLHISGLGNKTLMMDGRSLTIANHSGDPDSTFGRGVGGIRRGYKLHLICDLLGNCRAKRIEPLNVSEQAAAREMLRELQPGEADVLLADANYDSNELYQLAGDLGMQMLTPRRYGQAKGLGHRRNSEHRVRAIKLVKDDPKLLEPRRLIEGVFGTQGNTVGGLGPLPNFVRRSPRVTLWVTLKLVIDAAHRKRRHKARTV